jgi:hypothetical protein
MITAVPGKKKMPVRKWTWLDDEFLGNLLNNIRVDNGRNIGNSNGWINTDRRHTYMKKMPMLGTTVKCFCH